jgi:hypothetical protein
VLAGLLLPATAAASRHGPDFNRDGNHDLAVGVPDEDVGADQDAGAIHVFFGTDGRVVPNPQLWTQDSAGIANESEPTDRFGTSLAWGDFDGDDFDDLAIGVPLESFGAASRAGAVHVLYGAPTAPTAARSQFWHQNVADVEDTTETGDGFGAAVAAGDLTGDGFEDLLIGVPGENGVGAVQLLRGSPAGLTAAADDPLVSQDSDGADGSGEPGDAYGAALATGNSDLDGSTDAMVGVPGEDVGAVVDAGALQFVPGSPVGLRPNRDKFLSQDTTGIEDTADAFDRFGEVMTTGRFDDDQFEDIAIGVPREQQPGQEGFRTGAVHVLYGASTGPSGARSQYFTQDTPGLDGSDPSEPEEFGSALVAFGGSDRLAIGAPGEEVGLTALDGGSVTILQRTPSGLTGQGAQFITQDSPNIPDRAEGNDEFGAALGAADFDDGFGEELAVGAPGETLGNVLFAGAFNLIDLAVPSKNGFFHQATPGFPDFPEEEDRFASVLTG